MILFKQLHVQFLKCITVATCTIQLGKLPGCYCCSGSSIAMHSKSFLPSFYPDITCVRLWTRLSQLQTTKSWQQKQITIWSLRHGLNMLTQYASTHIIVTGGSTIILLKVEYGLTSHALCHGLVYRARPILLLAGSWGRSVASPYAPPPNSGERENWSSSIDQSWV